MINYETTVYSIEAPASLIAYPYYSGFPLAHDTYNAITAGSDGRIYYVLSSESVEEGGKLCVYDPETDQTRIIADLTEACGETRLGTISQGKSHVRFYEHAGKLYFATHIGYYEMIDGMERLPVQSPNGRKPYPGGLFLAYDLQTGLIDKLATAPHGEGILTMTIDRKRGYLYGITWPTGYFVQYNLNSGQLKTLPPVSAQGEAGIPGHDYRVLCRSMFVAPREGTVFLSTAEGDILCYRPDNETLERVEGADLRLDYFGSYDPTRPGSMGYNWRKIFWYEPEEVAYGIHGNSGYLFRFDPHQPHIELVERLTSEPSRRSGMFDQFSYGYLGFQLGPDGKTIYYLTGGPIYMDGRRVKGVDQIAKGAAKGLENLHLITFHLPTRSYRDHGPIFYPDGNRPTYVNSITIGHDGTVYTLARFEHEGREIQDLVRIPLASPY
ncbi:hypothetical protein [Spirosoma montaniterrae]|uniref:Uncharacterized protein n=1 Tax=Spirosoma montaniterrae TaxID=1178516 RepID=A0A1P9WS92_9BACT|nr:hypothetical protein [Spirosoma montaniterrae]AQG78222.1 hypothetical protein AWR27_01980 [Spirosoma montaniterrae]